MCKARQILDDVTMDQEEHYLLIIDYAQMLCTLSGSPNNMTDAMAGIVRIAGQILEAAQEIRAIAVAARADLPAPEGAQ